MKCLLCYRYERNFYFEIIFFQQNQNAKSTRQRCVRTDMTQVENNKPSQRLSLCLHKQHLDKSHNHDLIP